MEHETDSEKYSYKRNQPYLHVMYRVGMGLENEREFVGASGAIQPILLQKILKSKCHPRKKWGEGG